MLEVQHGDWRILEYGCSTCFLVSNAAEVKVLTTRSLYAGNHTLGTNKRADLCVDDLDEPL